MVLTRIADSIDWFNRTIGQAVGWLVLAMVLVQFLVVLFRHVFGLNSVGVQEAIVFMHGMVFMLAAAYILQIDKHVRIDIFYANSSSGRRRAINAVGTVFFLIPLMVLIGVMAWPYVAGSWRILEGSPDSGGLPVRYLQKSAILVFAVMMAMQGLAIILRVVVGKSQNR